MWLVCDELSSLKTCTVFSLHRKIYFCIQINRCKRDPRFFICFRALEVSKPAGFTCLNMNVFPRRQCWRTGVERQQTYPRNPRWRLTLRRGHDRMRRMRRTFVTIKTTTANLATEIVILRCSEDETHSRQPNER